MAIAIHHNPNCGTSRNVLAFIRAAGVEPIVIEYLKTGWTLPQLQALFAAAGLTPRAALRVRGTPAEALGLLAEGVSDAILLDAMTARPILVDRPIVCAPRGVRLCRPSETVLDLLDTLPPGPLSKEDGEMVIDAMGRRVRPASVGRLPLR